MIRYDDELKIFYSTLINDTQFFSGFSTRELGDGTQRQTILEFLKKNNVLVKKLVTLQQTHSANVAVVDSISQAEIIPDTDGVITSLHNVTLAIKTADCCPIVFADKKTGIMGVSHQGWEGSLHQLPAKMIRKMEDFGCLTSDICVAIGPTINDCCYNITKERYTMFKETFPNYSKYTKRMKDEVGDEKFFVNLIKLNYLELRELGVPEKNIDMFPFCTQCDGKNFYSYRREGKNLEGEMFSFITSS